MMEKDFSRLTIPCVTKPAIVNWLTDGVAAEVIFIFVLFIILFKSFLFAAVLTVTISVFVHVQSSVLVYVAKCSHISHIDCHYKCICTRAVLGSCICGQMLAYQPY